MGCNSIALVVRRLYCQRGEYNGGNEVFMRLKAQRKEDNKFLVWLGMFALVSFILYAPRETRSILGYEAAIVVYVVYILALLLLYRSILAKARATMNKVLRYLMGFLSVFAFSFFLTVEKFGGADICQIILLCGCLSVLLYEKREWLVVPLTAAAVGMGVGYIFLYGSIVPVLLLYKYFARTGARQRKYLSLFVLTIAVSAFMFIFCGGFNYFAEITLFCNFRRLGVFVLCFIPYLMMAFSFFRGLIRGLSKKAYGWFLGLGGITSVPLLALKNQGGSCIFAVFLFYALVIGMLLAMGDLDAIRQMERLKAILQREEPIGAFVLVYPVLFMPLNDASICRTVDYMVNLILP